MSNNVLTLKIGNQSPKLLIDKSLESERREDTDFISRNVFPIIAEVNRSISAPPPLLFFQYLVLFLQLLFGSYFIFHENNIFPDEFITFCKIIFFGMAGDHDSTFPFCIALFFVDLLSFILIIIIFLDYHNNHEFKAWQLYILRIWHGLLFSYFIFPNIFFASNSICNLYTFKDWESILLFIGSLIGVGYTVIHILFLSNLLNQSPFLFHSVSFYWRPPELFITFIICTIPYAVDGLYTKAHSGFRYFPPVLSILVVPYLIFKIYYLPFTYLFSNVAWCSLSVSMVVNSILSILQNIESIHINMYVYIFVPLGSLVLSWSVIWPLLYIRRRNIKNRLMYQHAFPDENINDELIEQNYLSTLNLHNKREAFTYVQVGVEEGADMYLDWSLTRHLFEIFENDGDILLFLTWTVSFFPSETSSILRTFILSIPKVQKLSLINRAMFYQLHRLHIFRQSTSTVEASADLSSIKKMNNLCISNFCQLWKNLSNGIEINPSLFNKLTLIRHSTEAAWAEVLDKYPNDSRFVDEYARFLLECRCQFRESIHCHQRACAIEKGTRLQNDRMFHRFVQMFPFYLKKGIVDTSGKIKKKLISNSNQQPNYTVNNAMQNDSSLEDSSDEVDLVEAEQYVQNAQLRLAFEKAVSEINSNILQKVIVAEIISFFIAMLFIILVDLSLIHMFDEKRELFSFLSSVIKIDITYELMIPKLTWMWTKETYGDITKEDEIKILGPSAIGMPSYLNEEAPDDQTIYNLSLTGLSYIDSFTKSLYQSDNKGDRIRNLAKLIFDTPINSAVYIPQNNSLYTKDQYISIDFLLRSLFINSAKLMVNPDFSNQTSKKALLCETYTKSYIMSEVLKLVPMNVSKSFSYEYQLLKRCNASHYSNNNSINIPDSPLECPDPTPKIGDPMEEIVLADDKEELDNTYLIFLIAFTPFLITALVYPSTVFLSSALWSEKMEMIKRLQSFSKQECIDASELIRKLEDDDDLKDDSIKISESNKSNIIIYIIDIFCVLCVIILILVQLISGIIYSSKFNAFIEHSTLFASLCDTIINSAHNSILLLFLNQTRREKQVEAEYDNLGNLEDQIKNSLRTISLIINMLKSGYNEIPSAHGYLGSYEELLYKDICDTEQSQYLIDQYRCISFYEIIKYFINSINDMLNSDDFDIKSNQTILFNKLIDTRLALGFADLHKAYEDNFNRTIHSFQLIVWICFSVTSVFIIISVFMEFFIVTISNRDIDTFKCLILRIDPITFASNPQALSLIYGKKSFVDTKIISASHSVFYSSSDAIMSLNQDGIIESLNPAASNIFGYTPEQMLGQNIKLLINPEIKNNNQLFYTIQLMKSGQCGLIFESDFSGSRDDETILPIKVTLIGFSSNDRVAGSFAIICKDKTEEEKQRVELEKAQKESEDLLLQFIPREMLSKLNQDEPEIGFSVPSSTVILMSIFNFSSYVESVQPKDLLENLSKIFRSFDKILVTIPTITRIKVVGDVFLAAAGLFNPDLLPSSHASDMLSFATKALESVEELNIQMNSSLQMRTGVHTGGPIIAGVFGKDKQLFDIIGQSVNVCQVLEKNCIPGTINVTNDTLSLLPPSRYRTEEHEMIEMEGIESQMTYTINLGGHMSASLTNSSFYTPPSLDALLSASSFRDSGCNSFNFDIVAPILEDNGNNDNGSFRMPSLSSLIDPPRDPPQ